MKWLVVASFIVCMATFSKGNAIREPLESKDAVSSKDKAQIDFTQTSINIIRVDKRSDAECLAGSEWESNCHRCRCSEKGRAECSRLETCKGKFGDPITCKPHTSFKRDCNTCTCLDNGLASCTRRGCLHLPKLPVRKLESGIDCLPKSSWTSKCNHCTCSDDGYPTCTEMACLGYENEPEMTCAPDTVWMNDCNSCTCSPHGRAMCTKMGCGILNATNFNPSDDDDGDDATDLDQTYLNDHNVVKRSPVCKPNALMKADCNFCQCASDGQSYSCTLNECIEPDIRDDVEVFKEEDNEPDEDQVNSKQVCKPRRTFYIGCNTCHCNFDGTSFTCTNKPCPLPDDVELFHELRVLRTAPTKKSVVCAANRMFIKDCNTCWCNEDGTSYFCTRKVCVAEIPEEVIEEKPENVQEIKRKCRPDEVFEMDCNTCRCSQDGTSFSCTRRACMPEEKGKNVSLNRRIRATSQGKTCQPGQEFRMDCNKCLCNDEGRDFSCTRNDCAALNSNGNVRPKRDVITTQLETECEAGTVFYQGCNLCRCTEDGKHATCAFKRCDEEKKEENNVPESDPSFRCNPGEQSKRDCNDCSCSADGKSVFCTLRLCDQDITPTI